MKCKIKTFISCIMTGMLLISGSLPAEAEVGNNTDLSKILNARSVSEDEINGPALYARNDGTWVKNDNGVWTYVDSAYQNVRNCWVKDGDGLYFIGYDGCLVKDNYTSDGYYVGPNGAWDSSKTQRNWDVTPYEGAYEGASNIWIFSPSPSGTFTSVSVAYKQTGEKYLNCSLTSVGHGCMMAQPDGSQDVYEQILISVSDDKSSVRVSYGGATEICEFSQNSYYEGSPNQSNFSYNNSGSNSYNNGNSYNNTYENYGNMYYEYVLPYSGIELLEDWQVEMLSDYELRIALNEIYARHGRKFKDKELQKYFNSLSWYVGIYEADDFDKAVDSILNDIEKKNVSKLVKERDRRK